MYCLALHFHIFFCQRADLAKVAEKNGPAGRGGRGGGRKQRKGAKRGRREVSPPVCSQSQSFTTGFLTPSFSSGNFSPLCLGQSTSLQSTPRAKHQNLLSLRFHPHHLLLQDPMNRGREGLQGGNIARDNLILNSS